MSYGIFYWAVIAYIISMVITRKDKKGKIKGGLNG